MPPTTPITDDAWMLGQLERDICLPGQVGPLEQDLGLGNEATTLSHQRPEGSAEPPITVITITRDRPDALEGAMASVLGQDYEGHVEHLIVVDDDDTTVASLAGASWAGRADRTVTVRLERRASGDDPTVVYPRLARLLNRGIQVAKGTWTAFLDDDNRFASDHLSSLVARARLTASPAVHSGRTIHWADGTPYLEPLFPHTSSATEARRIYALMCDRGVWVRGTNVLLDRADPIQTSYRNSTIMRDDDPVLLVDQNVWLIERALLLAHPIPCDFSPEDLAADTAPDDKLIEMLLRMQVPIARTDRPTVQYFLGGVSNPHNLRGRAGDD